MNIQQFDRECQIAKPGDNILYAQTGDKRAQMLNHAYQMYEAGIVTLVQRRTAHESIESDRLVKDVGTFDYIAQRTHVKW